MRLEAEGMSEVCCLVCGRPVGDPLTFFYDIFQIRGGEPGSRLKERLEGVLAVTFKDNHPLFRKICEHCEITLTDIETRVRNFRLSFQKSLKRYEIQRRTLLLNMGYDINSHQVLERGSETGTETESLCHGVPLEGDTLSSSSLPPLVRSIQDPDQGGNIGPLTRTARTTGERKRSRVEGDQSGRKVTVDEEQARLKENTRAVKVKEIGSNKMSNQHEVLTQRQTGMSAGYTWHTAGKPSPLEEIQPSQDRYTCKQQLQIQRTTNKQSHHEVPTETHSTLHHEQQNSIIVVEEDDCNSPASNSMQALTYNNGNSSRVVGHANEESSVRNISDVQKAGQAACSCNVASDHCLDGSNSNSSEAALDLTNAQSSGDGVSEISEHGDSALDLSLHPSPSLKKASNSVNAEGTGAGKIPEAQQPQDTNQQQQQNLQQESMLRLRENPQQHSQQQPQQQQQVLNDTGMNGNNYSDSRYAFQNLQTADDTPTNSANSRSAKTAVSEDRPEVRTKPTKPPPLIQVFEIKKEVLDDEGSDVVSDPRPNIVSFQGGQDRIQNIRPSFQYAPDMDGPQRKRRKSAHRKSGEPADFSALCNGLNTQVSATVNVRCANDINSKSDISSKSDSGDLSDRSCAKEMNLDKRSNGSSKDVETMETTTEIRGTLRIPLPALVPNRYRIPTTISLVTEATVVSGSRSSNSGNNDSNSSQQPTKIPLNLTLTNGKAKVMIPTHHQPHLDKSGMDSAGNVVGSKTLPFPYQFLPCTDPACISDPSQKRLHMKHNNIQVFPVQNMSTPPQCEPFTRHQSVVRQGHPQQTTGPALPDNGTGPIPARPLPEREAHDSGAYVESQRLPALVDSYNNEFSQGKKDYENKDTDGEEEYEEDEAMEEDEEDGADGESSPDINNSKKYSKNAVSGRRQLLRPWLEDRLNRGSIPGFAWVDKERQLFRIPWKHRSKNDWTPDNCTIFREWAIHTGKYSAGVDKADYCRWKTRLRCAFNQASDIRERKDLNKTKCAEPYKVYEFLPKEEAKKIAAMKAVLIQRRAAAAQGKTLQQDMQYSLASPNQTVYDGQHGDLGHSTSPSHILHRDTADHPSQDLPPRGRLTQTLPTVLSGVNGARTRYPNLGMASAETISGLHLASEYEANNNKDIDDLELASDQLVIDLDGARGSHAEEEKNRLEKIEKAPVRVKEEDDQAPSANHPRQDSQNRILTSHENWDTDKLQRLSNKYSQSDTVRIDKDKYPTGISGNSIKLPTEKQMGT